MSQSFTDSCGREWKLALDPFLITKVCDEVTWKPRPKPILENGKPKDDEDKIPLEYLLKDVQPQGVLLTEWSDNNFDLAERLRTDMRLLVSILWSICDEQAVTTGCKAKADAQGDPVYREFAKGLGGSILLSAVEALEVAIINFSRNPAERESLMEVRKKATQMTDILQKKRMEMIQNLDVAQTAENFIASVSSSLASSGLTPSPEESRSDS